MGSPAPRWPRRRAGRAARWCSGSRRRTPRPWRSPTTSATHRHRPPPPRPAADRTPRRRARPTRPSASARRRTPTAATSTTCADRGDRAEEQADEDRHRRGDERRGPDGRHRDQPAGDRLVAPPTARSRSASIQSFARPIESCPATTASATTATSHHGCPTAAAITAARTVTVTVGPGCDDANSRRRVEGRRVSLTPVSVRTGDCAGATATARAASETTGRGPLCCGGQAAGMRPFGFRTYFVAAPLSNSS